jgi:hypothetical protein
MTRAKLQYVIKLGNVDYINCINNCYNSNKETNVQSTELKITSGKQFSFYDTNKNKITVRATMVDYIGKLLPQKIDKPCWWCGYEFSSQPIGLPLRYFPSSIENVFKQQIQSFLKENNMQDTPYDYFETEGIFCSFSCCKAFIVDRPFNEKYKKSATLLYLLYTKFNEESKDVSVDSLSQKDAIIKEQFKEVDIYTAPHWSCLEKWGGPLTIEEFRSSMNTFILTTNFHRPFMFPISMYVESK